MIIGCTLFCIDHSGLKIVLFIDGNFNSTPLIYICSLQVNGNHETMNVEGDFRYVDSGGFDECSDFLEYLNDYKNDWEEAFVGWVGMSERWKEDRRLSRNYWGPLNLVKVLQVLTIN